MEPSAGISFGGGWASLDGGRLSGFWPNDARYGEAWMHANSIEADSGDYDGGSSDAGAEGGVGAGAGFFDSHGWGFGMSVVTRRESAFEPYGRFGWDGGMGTSWYSDPREDMVTILMTLRAWTSPRPPNVFVDFWNLAYQAIDD